MSCISCDISTYMNEAWTHSVRGLYSTSDGVHVTDICYFDIKKYRYILSSKDRAVWETMGWSISFHFHDNVFLFHNVCWELLMEHFKPGELCLDRLFEMCQLVPCGDIGTNFSRNPDPSEAPDISKLMDMTSNEAKIPPTITMISAGTDCFGALPAEIRTEILKYLQTIDMLNVRLASRVMATVFYDQTFWKSRFEINSDRGYLAYLLYDVDHNKRRREKPDWRFLYHITNKFKSKNCDNNEISQREGIWAKNKWLRQVTNMARRPAILSTDPSGTELESTQNLIWKTLKADKKRDNNCHPVYRPESFSSRIFSQSTYIPQSVKSIVVYVLKQMDMTCITGLEFICQDQRNITLGYKLPESRVEVHMTGLKGFVTAISSGGVCALQPITHSHSGKWLGLPSDGHYCSFKDPYLRVFISKRLIFNTNIAAIRCTFNEYRLVDLAVGRSEPFSGTPEIQSHIDNLRQNALWHPRIPESGLCLNEDWFLAEDPLVHYHQPIYWTLFGDENGHKLRSLTEIEVELESLRLAFYYNNDTNPELVLFMGHDQTFTDSKALFNNTHTFLIDGPSDEIIDTVYVQIEWKPENNNSYRHFKRGIPRHYMISTNRGRFFLFSNTSEFSSKEKAEEYMGLEFTKMEISPGTTIIGIYSTKNITNGVVSIGVISAAI